MTWSFIASLPTDKDKVRALIGDKDSADQLLSDEEIVLHLTLEGSLYGAAAAACRAVAAMFSRRVDFAQSGLSLSASQRAAAYLKMADRMERRARDGAIAPEGIGLPVVSGVSESAIEGAREDPDLVQPRIRHDLHENQVPPAAQDVSGA